MASSSSPASNQGSNPEAAAQPNACPSHVEGKNPDSATGRDSTALQGLSRLLDALCSKTSGSSSSPTFSEDLASTAETINMIETVGSKLQEELQEEQPYNPNRLNELTSLQSEPCKLHDEYKWLRASGDSLTLRRLLHNAETRQNDIGTQKDNFCQRSQELLTQVKDFGLDQVVQDLQRLQDQKCTAIQTASQLLAEVAAEDTDKPEGERRFKAMDTILLSKFTSEELSQWDPNRQELEYKNIRSERIAQRRDAAEDGIKRLLFEADGNDTESFKEACKGREEIDKLKDEMADHFSHAESEAQNQIDKTLSVVSELEASKTSAEKQYEKCTLRKGEVQVALQKTDAQIAQLLKDLRDHLETKKDLSIEQWFCRVRTLELRHAMSETETRLSTAKEHKEKTVEAWKIVQGLAASTTTEVTNTVNKDAKEISALLTKPVQAYMSNAAFAKALLIEYGKESSQHKEYLDSRAKVEKLRETGINQGHFETQEELMAFKADKLKKTKQLSNMDEDWKKQDAFIKSWSQTAESMKKKYKNLIEDVAALLSDEEGKESTRAKEAFEIFKLWKVYQPAQDIVNNDKKMDELQAKYNELVVEDDKRKAELENLRDEVRELRDRSAPSILSRDDDYHYVPSVKDRSEIDDASIVSLSIEDGESQPNNGDSECN